MSIKRWLLRLDPDTLEFSDPEEFSEKAYGELERLQKAVGGYVELVRLADSVDCYCDEDGISKRLKPTAIVHRRGLPFGMTGTTLVGPLALVVRSGQASLAYERVRTVCVPLRAFRHTDRAQPESTPQ